MFVEVIILEKYLRVPLQIGMIIHRCKKTCNEQIKSKTFVLEVGNRAGDPATTESYEGGDDAHEKAGVGGWDTDKDALGGVIVND